MALTDQKIDPETLDYIDDGFGDWEEADDSRTSVLMALQIRFNRWAGDPTAGSRIGDLLESTTPTNAVELRDAALQALQPLVDDGTIATLSITIDADPAGRDVLLLQYNDRRSGRPVDLVYAPFGG